MGSVVTMADAQLLEDTDSKLKNAKVERRGFLFFRNKRNPKKSAGIPANNRTQSAVRYSSAGSPFKAGKGQSPRYSAPQSRANRYSISVRSSPGSPFRGNQYRSAPRYSLSNPFRGSAYKISPRYSRSNPFRGQDYKRTTRYSPSTLPLAG